LSFCIKVLNLPICLECRPQITDNRFTAWNKARREEIFFLPSNSPADFSLLFSAICPLAKYLFLVLAIDCTYLRP
jgi:hypothetical protein